MYSNNSLLDSVWFTSDLHLLHPKVVRYSNRPIDVEEHDEWIIARINEKVKKTDTLYILGDISLKSKSNVLYLLQKINCENIHFIEGNHDDEAFIKNVDNFFTSTSQIKDLSYNFEKFGEVKISLCHYPLLRWNKQRHGAIHLHGHDHNEYIDMADTLDIGVDAQNYYPISLRDVILKLIVT